MVLDEAHRFVPSGGDFQHNDEGERITKRVETRGCETRKYGVGWMFISQTMQGVDTEILMQLRAMFLGYGLAFGLEFRRLQELAGGDDDSMTLYRSFRDPQSAIDARSKDARLALGPVSCRSLANRCFFSASMARNDQDALTPFSDP